MPAISDSVAGYRQKMHDVSTHMARDEQVIANRHAASQAEDRQRVQSLKEEGNVAFQSGEFSRARQLYSEAIELDFTVGADDKLTAVLYANRAAAALSLGDHEDAERDCRRALQREDTTKCRVRCVKACLALGRADAALHHLACALTLDPRHREARNLLATYPRDSPSDLYGAVSADAMARLRKRAAARDERGAHDQAQAYRDVIASIVSLMGEQGSSAETGSSG